MSDLKNKDNKKQKSVEQLSEEMRLLKEEKFKSVQIKVSEFLSGLKSEGFGLDATIEASRYGNKVNIFVVEIPTQS